MFSSLIQDSSPVAYPWSDKNNFCVSCTALSCCACCDTEAAIFAFKTQLEAQLLSHFYFRQGLFSFVEIFLPLDEKQVAVSQAMQLSTLSRGSLWKQPLYFQVGARAIRQRGMHSQEY
ncbi:unnamed protein product [Cuscuta campestris]|uniref:Uncharacterized protein n=1 Tax=Cuscuta campestris TaxID=132261 RepID=A0A484KHG0_9ASTE|nr:unnamed protein product [Cuscuta campestris]